MWPTRVFFFPGHICDRHRFLSNNLIYKCRVYWWEKKPSANARLPWLFVQALNAISSTWYIYIYIYIFIHFFSAVVSILLYGCTTWMLTKWMEKKLDGNYTRMLWAILNKSRRQHPPKQQLYGHQPPITKTIKIRRTRHAGHSWRSRDELISYVLLWTPSHGRAKAGRPARNYIKQLWADTGCSPEDLPEAMDDMEGGRERVRDIRVDSVTWWWWCWYIYIYIYRCVCVNYYIFIYIYSQQVDHRCRRWSEGSLFDSYYSEVYGKVLLLSLNCSTYPWSITYNVEC